MAVENQRAGAHRGLALLLAAVLGLGACGSGTATAGGSAPETAGDALAKLDVIDADASVRSGTVTDFVVSATGKRLDRGDGVKTNTSGYAEVNYFDGSLVRVDRESAFDVVELANADGAKTIKNDLKNGSSWQRVEKLGEKDRFETVTPVGTAAVRGTAFAIECPSDNECTFSVLEGVVRVTALDGTVVDVKAGETLKVKKNEKPGPVATPGVNHLRATDPWIGKNMARDAGRRGTTPGTAPQSGPGAGPENEVRQGGGEFSAEGGILSGVIRVSCVNGAEPRDLTYSLRDGRAVRPTRLGPGVYEIYEPGVDLDGSSGGGVKGRCDGGGEENPSGPGHQRANLYTVAERNTWRFDNRVSHCPVGGTAIDARHVVAYAPENHGANPDWRAGATILAEIPYVETPPGSELYEVSVDGAQDAAWSEGTPADLVLTMWDEAKCDYSQPVRTEVSPLESRVREPDRRGGGSPPADAPSGGGSSGGADRPIGGAMTVA